MRPDARELALYIPKAIFALAILTAVGAFAPRLPVFAFPVFFLAYALPSTISIIYGIATNRIYKQFRYARDGQFARFNRRWRIRMAIVFFIGMLSSLVFVVNAPRWGIFEWAMIWASAAAYVVVYRIAVWKTERQFTPRFVKAASMKVSFFAVAILACVIYAVLQTLGPVEDVARLSDYLKSPPLAFADSPVLLLTEFDKVASLMHAVTDFGMEQVLAESYVLGVIARFLVFASIIFGLMGIFGFCLLNGREIKSTFEILPAFDESERLQESEGISKFYIGSILVLWLLFSGAFLFGEFEVQSARASGELTIVDEFVDNRVATLVRFVERGEDAIELAQQTNESKKELVEQYRGQLQDSINEYYDACEGSLDAYLDWRDGFFGQIVSFARAVPFADWAAFGSFNSDVMNSDSASSARDAFEGTYSQCMDDVRRINEDFLERYKQIESDNPLTSMIDFGLREEGNMSVKLWPSVEDSGNGGSYFIRQIFPSREEGVDRDVLKERLISLVNDQREKTLEALDQTLSTIGGQE